MTTLAPDRAASSAAPFVPWGDVDAALDWRQGEHVTLVGPTGCGKTTLGLHLLGRRDWVCVIGTKPRDRTLDGLRREGYRRLEEWPPPQHWNRVLLWPKRKSLADRYTQAAAIAAALEAIYRTGAWCVFADELQYLCERLGLADDLAELWQQGRSLGVSIVGASQRPRYVPLAAYSQATHLFLWRSNDEADLRRLSELNGADTRTVRAVLPQLGRHEVLYVNTRDGLLWRTVPPPRP